MIPSLFQGYLALTQNFAINVNVPQFGDELLAAQNRAGAVLGVGEAGRAGEEGRRSPLLRPGVSHFRLWPVQSGMLPRDRRLSSR
ncbi:MAG: hypothetical protein ACO34J_05205 [Prochlorothrix sp.]